MVRRVRRIRSAGKTIVALCGSFDVLHYGHIQYLQKARAQGDILMVLLNSDHSVRLYKGPGRPINPLRKRAAVLSALECVDHVVVFNGINPLPEICALQPELYCNGADWGKGFLETETVLAYGGKIKLIHLSKGDSTSSLIRNLSKKQDEIRAVFIDRDGTINDNSHHYYVFQKKTFHILPGVIKGLQRLSETDYKIIIVTNQSGIAKGQYTEKDLDNLHQWLLRHFRQRGIRIDHIYHCPHDSQDACKCRKPGIGMILQAARHYGLNLSKSWVIGDGEVDVLMGRTANIPTMKLGARMKRPMQPNYYAKNLDEAVRIIQRHNGH